MSGADLALRRAVPGDAELLAPFMARCFLAAYAHASTPERIARFVARVYAVPQLRAELADPQLPTWIQSGADGQWTGFARLDLSGAEIPVGVPGRRPLELQRFYVAPEWHGRGCAAPLMQCMQQQALAAGADALWLKVWQQAPQALRFYQKQGFRILGPAVFMIEDDAKDDWAMGLARAG